VASHKSVLRKHVRGESDTQLANELASPCVVLAEPRGWLALIGQRARDETIKIFNIKEEEGRFIYMDIRLGTEDVKSQDAWRATLAEFIAVLLFVFLGPGAVVSALSLSGGVLNAASVVAIAGAFGLAIALLVTATAPISGGHINPAVTFAVVMNGKMSVTKGCMYWAGQLVGAILGALLLAAVIPDAIQGNLGANALAEGVSSSAGFLLEAVLTFAFVFVVFATAIDPKGMRHLAPVAIGLAILVGHLVAVPFTGTSMNPARSLGPAVVADVWTEHWVFWVGPLVGSGLAALVYKYAFMRIK